VGLLIYMCLRGVDCAKVSSDILVMRFILVLVLVSFASDLFYIISF
jgi:hypothetical protein